MAENVEHAATVAHTEAPGGVEHEATALGFGPGGWVAIAMQSLGRPSNSMIFFCCSSFSAWMIIRA